MRTLIVLFVALSMAFTGCAKNKKQSAYVDFYKQYSDSSGTVTLKMPASFARIFIDRDEKELRDLMKKMDKISIFVGHEGNLDAMRKDLNIALSDPSYQTVMEIKSDQDNVDFKLREQGEAIDELLMHVESEEGELVVICIQGEFTFEDIKMMASSMSSEKAMGGLSVTID